MKGPAGVVRALRLDEAEANLRLLCAAFGLPEDAARPIFYQDPFFDLSHKRGLFLPDGRLASCLTIIPAQIRIGNAIVPLGGVAGVATPPQFQRQGCASALLRATVSDLADTLGCPVSALFAAAPAFYRRFGWEIASRSVCWAASPGCLTDCSEADRVHSVPPQDWTAVHKLHGELTAGHTGAFVRDARRWQVIQSPVPDSLAVVCEGGYLLGERRDDVLHVWEMHGADDAARRALVGFLARQNCRRIEWSASLERLQTFRLPCSPDMPEEPGILLRLTDARAALALVHAANLAPVLEETGQTLTLRAHDALRPANAAPVRLTSQAVEPGALTDACWIDLDIRALSTLYLGDKTPSQLQTCGLLRASSPSALALADRLFPCRAPYVAWPDQF